ncbi:MAG: hypothetical protein HN548_02335 [Opitutae bacterium]|nr:hypothetical protein [Opitutae bacterium]
MINSATGFIKQGYGVASGKSNDVRFPEGTVSMQIPFFSQSGLDLSAFFPGTLNISFPEHSYQLGEAQYFFPLVEWSKDLPPENFSFFSCTLQVPPINKSYEALIYWPHPSTKPGFHQDPNVLEILAPKINELKYGDEIIVFADVQSVRFISRFA